MERLQISPRDSSSQNELYNRMYEMIARDLDREAHQKLIALKCRPEAWG
jgi:hypothetical protein